MTARRSSIAVLTAWILMLGSIGAAAQMVQPGPEHDAMKQLVGEWTGEVVFQMPGMPEPMKSEVTQNVTLDHGGLWLNMRFEGTMMGAPFSGESIMGYDPALGKYVEIWVDSMRTEMQKIEGTYDAATRTWTKSLQGKHPMTGEPITERHTQRVVDEDHLMYEMAFPGPDGEYVTYMQVQVARAK